MQRHIPIYAPPVTAIAILPVKSFHLGKGRLAEALGPDVRARLGRALAKRTSETAERAGLIPIVVAGDDTVAEWSASRGVSAIPDPGGGLSRAASEGVAWANRAGSPWMVLHTDLPLLTVEELKTADALLTSGGDLIAPSTDGGTSLIGSADNLEFAYGPGSFSTHLPRLRNPTVLAVLGLLHDLDSPGDLESARLHPRGGWLRELLE